MKYFFLAILIWAVAGLPSLALAAEDYFPLRCLYSTSSFIGELRMDGVGKFELVVIAGDHRHVCKVRPRELRRQDIAVPRYSITFEPTMKCDVEMTEPLKSKVTDRLELMVKDDKLELFVLAMERPSDCRKLRFEKTEIDRILKKLKLR